MLIDLISNYGLFLLKALTVLIVSIAIIGALFSNISKTKDSKENGLVVEYINDKYDEYNEVLVDHILDKSEKKKYHKKLKKEKKLIEDKDKKRLYVISFDGDIEANEVEHLRESITAILNFADKEDEVLLRLESPGGVVHNYGLAASQLLRLKSKGLKLTVAVDLIAASGGYMMACVADEIISAPFALLGSIGVYAQIPNFNKLLTKNNVEIEHHTAGEYKTTLTTLGKNSDEGRLKFKQELNEIHVLFKHHVKEARPSLNVDEVATGEAWYGLDAIKKNLVDKLETSDDYLLSKKNDYDMYEVRMEEHLSLKDKISNMVSKKSLNGFIKNLYYNLNLSHSKGV